MSFRGVNPRASAVDLRRSYITGGNTVLPFSLLTFARNSAEYILYNGVLTKQASVNTPATRNIGGRVFMQSEPALTQKIQYSDRLDNAYWDTFGFGLATATPNAGTDPLGGNTACLLTTIAGASGSRKLGPMIPACDGTFSVFCRAGSQGAIAGIDWIEVGDTPVTWTPGATWERHILIGSASVNRYPWIFNASTRNGVGAAVDDNHYYWGAQVNLGTPVIPSPIPNNSGADLVKPKTEGYWAEATVNAYSWIRDRFYFEIITHAFDDSILAADGGEKHLCSFDATAGAVRIYLDGADNKIKWDLVGTGNLGESAALTPTLDGKVRCWFTFDNGSNSVLRVIGAGLDAEYTGTSCAAADGHVYWGQREDATLQPSCLISQPEKW